MVWDKKYLKPGFELDTAAVCEGDTVQYRPIDRPDWLDNHFVICAYGLITSNFQCTSTPYSRAQFREKNKTTDKN